MDSARFNVSEEEDLTSGSRTRVDHSRALAEQIIIKVRKGTEKASDMDIRKGLENAPLASVRKGVTYILI